MQEYADFIHVATAFEVKVNGTKDIEQSYLHPFNPSITERPPLFALELGPVDGVRDGRGLEEHGPPGHRVNRDLPAARGTRGHGRGRFL